MWAELALRQTSPNYDKLYSYSVPESMVDLCPGCRVRVPFGRASRLQEAVVWRICDDAKRPDFPLKTIKERLEDFPVLNADQMRLAEQMRIRYAATYGEALRGMLPPGLSGRVNSIYIWRGGGTWQENEESLKLRRYKRAQAALDAIQAAGTEGVCEGSLLDLGVSRRFLAALEALPEFEKRTLFTPGIREQQERYVYLPDPAAVEDLLGNNVLRSAKQARVLELLLDYGDMTYADLLQQADVSASVVRGLEKRCFLQIAKRTRTERGDAAEREENANAGCSCDGDDAAALPELTAEQAAALRSLTLALQRSAEERMNPRRHAAEPHQEFLLHGITGSGKTEVYLRAAAYCLDQGAGAIILVPEISLTPQMIARFRRRFGESIALIHSRLTPRERYEQWRRIQRGEVRLLVGARSALFMPLTPLGLIVIDEEQDGAYLSEQRPRYDSRSIARLRARDSRAVLVLGSATPSIETYARTEEGRSTRLELRSRPGGARLPRTWIVDMREELKQGHIGPEAIYSRPLIAALEGAFKAGEQAMIFLNRRGYSALMLCRSCGERIQCPRCQVNMTWHAAGAHQPERLICHYCGLQQPIPKTCPSCGSGRIGAFGVGTQQAAAVFRRLFPEQRVLRMDQDTTRGREAHAEILERFRRGEADVLIGTQMIAKGHDFPSVTVLGILACDQLFAGDDFRANERAFHLMMQAAGRAGRAEREGSVYFQTFNPELFTIRAAAAQDYGAFYREELPYRKLFQYPPYGCMLSVVCSGLDRASVVQAVDLICRRFRRCGREDPAMSVIEVLDPKPAWPPRLYDRSRFQILVRAPEVAQIAYLMLLVRRLRLPPEINLSLSPDPA